MGLHHDGPIDHVEHGENVANRTGFAPFPDEVPSKSDSLRLVLVYELVAGGHCGCEVEVRLAIPPHLGEGHLARHNAYDPLAKPLPLAVLHNGI